MDAVKFVEERRRMNRHNAGRYAVLFGGMDAAELVKETEEWSAAHPRKTRQDVFLKQWPEAYIHEDGYLDMCPLEVSAAHRDADGGCAMLASLCPGCRREFWMKEVE